MALLVRPTRLLRSAIVLKPSTLLELVLKDKGLRNYGTDAPRSEQAGQVSKEMDKKRDEIAHRRIVPGREIPRKYGQNNNSPATGKVVRFLHQAAEGIRSVGGY